MANVNLVYNRFQPPLANPTVTSSVVGATGSSTYTYTVTAVNECGETDGTSITVENAPDSLSTLSYVRLSWGSVDRARKYRIYRDGSFVYETDQTEFDDTGAYTPDPSRIPPEYNETEEYKYLLWDSVAVVPSRFAQSAEINELQEIIFEKLKRLGDAFFEEGDIIKGCSLSVNPDTGEASLTEGYIYAHGAIRYIPSATLTIPTEGTVYIGTNVNINYIDEGDNPYLLDPAQDTPGYGQPGAYRRIVNLEWTYADDESDIDVVVWKVVDGSVFLYRDPVQYSVLEKTIARKLDDFHGPTLVDGLDVRLFPSNTRRDEVVIEVSPGKAYVDGYELTIPSRRKYTEKVSLEYNTITEETDSKIGWKYKVDNSPVKYVDTVTIRVKVAETRTVPSAYDACGWYFDDTGISLDSILSVWTDSSKSTPYTFSNSDPGCAGRDPGVAQVYLSGSGFALDTNTFTSGGTYYIEYLKYYTAEKGVREKSYNEDTFVHSSGTLTYNLTKTDIINSDKTPVVIVDSNEITYQVGKDFTVDTGRTDDSITTASITFINEPGDGVSFTVKYYYWDHVVEGDFVSVDSYLDDDDPYQDYTYDDIEEPDIIDFRASGTKPPDENTSIIVEYSYYLPQKAVLILQSDGDFRLVRGEPGIRSYYPVVSPNVLIRSRFELPPFSQDWIVYEDNRFRAKKTKDLNIIESRVQQIEYNFALTALELEALSKHTINPKRALLTDSFTNTVSMDKNSTASLVTYKGELIAKRRFFPISPSVASTTNILKKGRIYLLPYTEVLYDSQYIWTEDFAQSVNPYDAYGPFTIVKVYPETDLWVEEDTEYTVRFKEDEMVHGTIRRLRGSVYYRDRMTELVSRMFHVDPSSVTVLYRYETNLPSGIEAMAYWYSTSTTTIDSSIVTDVEFIPYLRQRIIYLWITGCLPNEDNIYVLFDNNQVDLSIPTRNELDLEGLTDWPNAGSAGSTSGMVKADGNGEVVCKFVIPKNTPAGEKDIVVKALSGNVYAEGDFFGLGMTRHIRGIIEKVRVKHIVYLDYSPLAQSFTVSEPEGIFVTSVSFWVHRVPPTHSGGLKVTIKTMSNDGYPTNTVLGSKVLSKSEIMSQMGISDPSQPVNTPTTDNKVTFTFDEPIYLPPGEYCFAIEDMAPGYYVFVSRINKKILGKVDDSNYSKVGSLLKWQPHGGLMFISANNKTWEVDQSSDLMFEIKKAKFNPTSGSIVFSLPNTTSFSHFNHIANIFAPPGTSVAPAYRVGSGGYTSYEVQTDTESSTEYPLIEMGALTSGSNVDLKWNFRTDSANVSPVFRTDLNVIYAYYHESGMYYTNMVSIDPDVFEYIKVWIDERTNSGSVNYSVTFNGLDWYPLPLEGTQALAQGFSEKELGGSVSDITGGATSYASQFKVKIEINNDPAPQYTPVLRRLRVIVY